MGSMKILAEKNIYSMPFDEFLPSAFVVNQIKEKKENLEKKKHFKVILSIYEKEQK